MRVIRTIALSERLILSYILVSAVAIASLGGMAYYLSRKALLERTYNQLTSVRTLKKSQVENFFTDREREVSLVAESTDVGLALSYLEKPKKEEALRELNKFSQTSFYYHFLQSANHYWCFRIGNLQGKSFLIRNKSKDNPENIDLDDKSIFISEKSLLSLDQEVCIIQDFSEKSGLEKPVLWISTAIRDKNGKICGFFSAGIAKNPLESFMLESDASRGLGQTGESYLVGHDHLFRTQSRFEAKDFHAIPIFTEGVDNAFKQGSGTGIYEDYRHVKVIGSYDKIHVAGLNWVIMVELDFPEAMVPIFNLKNNLMLLSAFIALMMFVLTYFIARRITLPLVRLKNAAQEISEGKLSLVELPETHDEILELAETFNKMVNELDIKSQELNRERTERLSAVLDGQEQERQRLSRELHDGLGQHLAAVKLRMESIRPEDPEHTRKTISELSHGIDQTIDEIRRITNDLMPAVLKEFGLLTAIRTLCESTTGNAGIHLIFEAEANNMAIDSKAQNYLFRILQEAMTNIIKHARASKIIVQIYTTGNVFILNIEDNGRGFHHSQVGTGNGLSNIRERINLIHGKLDISSFPGKGTRIGIEIPLNTQDNG
ncbi:MAG: histidine kinase [Bacteroidota bacterium]